MCWTIGKRKRFYLFIFIIVLSVVVDSDILAAAAQHVFHLHPCMHVLKFNGYVGKLVIKNNKLV